MAQYLDLEKAVDYLVDETSEGAPFRDGKEFVRGHFLEKKVDPPQPPHGKVFEVIRTGRNASGATVFFRGENPSDQDLENQADLFRLSGWQRRDPQDLRRGFALPIIVRLCTEGRWKADGKKPGSAEREDIRARDFIGSEIDEYTGDFMSTPGPTSNRPESKEAIWTELMFCVPDIVDEGEVAELLEPAIEERSDDDAAPAPEMVSARETDRLKPATLEKYRNWCKQAQTIRNGKRWPPGDLAGKVAMHFEKDEVNKGKDATIQRYLDKHFPGWAG